MQRLRLLLWPFSVVYGFIVSIRNWLFDKGFLKTYVIPNKSICVGNITVGGTGKSPMTIYIVELLRDFKPAILSRGYGRATKGPILAGENETASTIGDEPYMYRLRFGKEVPVVVAEERKLGVELLNQQVPDSTIVLDDAFQHRKVKAGLQLVLTTFDRPIFNDHPFPAGNLRETRRGLKRADVVVVTKCPEIVEGTTKTLFAQKLHFPAEKVFFTKVVYGDLRPVFSAFWEEPETVLLVTGIANPLPLKQHLEKQYKVELMDFPDHHVFTTADLQRIHQKVATFAGRRFAIVTTEKDAVRLLGLAETEEVQSLPWFYQRMSLEIDRKEAFNNLLLKYVTGTNERSR
ncbi:MAG: tetraacyldisaccharide 4'-kinase [Candidatus Fluviicola riflensis]|nr:MAG: tetraacyldisaccharide 4'-kinase [Candidatus Fluviicola riflensis]OGS75917.1 MAG: tetraacyldisaccharide 4'-kinase [Candidatus Fluviicola riflensis]OGS83597.1 MAG: tetraacyldisaccharide 4'-kinase [Fluviicola sp. RIFCSPHIGHO2_01_FULL_43_53]OGS85736.1 MAG: tetraacyldisaccharide 4'-kinase [Fluviicola sp. RIFCSPHIGHO2_12_FULL_43_24]